ncbi:GntR family transcriptional regulator [Pseudacidovorax sp. RU35E]|uniref:GntR family transcriptional regulator n=1 Tax=Pseudacidovorax sp. RU35E TaxID=1907403 RepID=UPI000955B3C0|nr:GntR family transcriptional regulator [Pseudacidovorax sp. RU35E]SIR70775.1 GntR family transcriptional regulator [Pseudacidovorax sp. RU35E]
MTTRSSPIAKYHRVEVMPAEPIRSGVYPDGALPTERALALEFGVARVTVRHALRRLEDQSLVTRHERRVAATVSPERTARRRRLREHVDQFLDRGRADHRKVLRFGSVEATLPVAGSLGIGAGERVLRVVRLRSRVGVPLTYTESFVPQRLAHLLDLARLLRQPLIRALEEGGLKVGGAQQSVRAERCPANIAAALGVPEHEPVLRLERVVSDEARASVQLLLGWRRADCFEIRMESSRAEDLTRVCVHAR